MLDRYYKRPEGPLPEDMAVTRRLLGMTEESIRRDVHELTEWMKEQPDLPDKMEGVDMDWWLENYLIMNKNQLDRVKESLPLYFRLKTILPEIMVSDRDPFTRKEMIQAYNTTTLAIMPPQMEGGYKVGCFMHRPDTPAADYNPIGLAMHLTCMADLYLCLGFDHTKLVLVVDLSSLRMGHLTKYPLGLLRRFFLYAWRAYPERVAQINIINPPGILSVALALFKPLLKAKIRNRIIVHRNFESLLENVPLKYLPKEYGGECPSMLELHEAWRQKVADHQGYLKTCVATHRVLNEPKPTRGKSASTNK
ncbi:uncharacterized protein LOC126847404 [Adelges cooleyi]|uniref:uncharacterized protein LOC126847404 n=1 Tax=Adelges cooleyi TaxID=133065 RepID=UPI0021801B62|nr:uncharacterized protein LOC126847404 [Adelges cooleyi]XP_050443566.1 uncharacterized protein LOC126847404 [Adelges cooleyi]